MKIKQLVSAIAEMEGLKSQVSIGNIREIVGLVCDLMVSDNGETIVALVNNGHARGKRKPKKKK